MIKRLHIELCTAQVEEHLCDHVGEKEHNRKISQDFPSHIDPHTGIVRQGPNGDCASGRGQKVVSESRIPESRPSSQKRDGTPVAERKQSDRSAIPPGPAATPRCCHAGRKMKTDPRAIPHPLPGVAKPSLAPLNVHMKRSTFCLD
jgi:hypothetical protein